MTIPSSTIPADPLAHVATIARESALTRDRFVEEYGSALIEAARLLAQCLQRGGKILIFGNGGSAADAQHMAAEMVGRMLGERRALPAIALTTDTSNLTAIGNDYGYDLVFSRQIEALARPQDVVVAISTSGTSRNVIAGVQAARRIGATVIGMTGGSGGRLKGACDLLLSASAGANSCRIQETHIFAIHAMIDLLDRYFLDRSDGDSAAT